MDTKTTAFLLLCISTLAGCATIKKLEGIKGSVKFIETDFNFNTYVITKNTSGEHFYALNYRNSIIFEKDFNNVKTLTFNRKNQLYLFDVNKSDKTSVWVFDRQFQGLTPTMRNVLNYSSPIPGFFDKDDNLFFNSATGISILRPNATVPTSIEYLDSLKLVNDLSHAIDRQGNVFLGLVTRQSPIQQVIALLEREEINKPDPASYLYSFYSYGNIVEMTVFSNAVVIATTSGLITLHDDFYTFLHAAGYVKNLHSTNEKLFYDRTNNRYIYFARADDKTVSTLYSYYGGIFQEFDKEGNAFIADVYQSRVYVIGHNETTTKQINNIPNSLFISGMTENGKGDVWVLAQNLYFIPRGSKNAVKWMNLPFARNRGPIKARAGTNDVFIGLDDKLYIASSRNLAINEDPKLLETDSDTSSLK